MPRLKVLRNIGSEFYRAHGIAKLPENKTHEEGKTYDFSDDDAKVLIKESLAEPADAFAAVPEAAAVHGVPAKKAEK